MKRFAFVLVALALATGANPQTIIATVQNSHATENHNQRKIVRDNDHHIYVFYQDYVNGSWGIYQVRYDSLTSNWSQPEYLVPGNNPAAAIGFTDSIFLTYRSNDANGKIMLMKKAPGSEWLPPVQISQADSLDNVLPVADVDMEERVLVSWIEKGNPDEKVMFYKNGMVNEIYASDSISDLSLSTSLQWNIDNAFFVALEESGERVKFFKFNDINEMEILLDTLGTKPCQSIGAYSPGNWESLFPRLMYIDDEKNLSLASVECWGSYYYIYGPNVLVDGLVFDVAIDDILEPIGFSFLYTKFSGFYHAFASHSVVPYPNIIDWLPFDSFNFSIAYKHFSPTIADFIWMDQAGMNYDIYYKRSNKIEYIPGINVNAYNDNKDILVTLSSNPFITVINLNITGSELIKPVVKIYDLAGKLINTIEEINYSGNSYSCQWTGDNESRNEVKAGSYIINIKMGKHVLNNLIVKE